MSENRAEYQKRYYEEHKDEIKAKKAEWYQQNKDRIRAKVKAYQEANPESVKAKKKKYYDAHREEILKKQNARRAEARKQALSKMSEKPVPVQRMSGASPAAVNPVLARILWEDGRSVQGIALHLGVEPEAVEHALEKNVKIPYIKGLKR